MSMETTKKFKVILRVEREYEIEAPTESPEARHKSIKQQLSTFLQPGEKMKDFFFVEEEGTGFRSHQMIPPTIKLENDDAAVRRDKSLDSPRFRSDRAERLWIKRGGSDMYELLTHARISGVPFTPTDRRLLESGEKQLEATAERWSTRRQWMKDSPTEFEDLQQKRTQLSAFLNNLRSQFDPVFVSVAQLLTFSPLRLWISCSSSTS